MQKPKPTARLIWAITHGEYSFLEHIHHGLYEYSLKNLYPYLNLDETLAFASESWLMRSNGKLRKDMISKSNIYSIFREIYSPDVFRKLNKNKSRPPEFKMEYKIHNPYGRTLAKRLARAADEDISKLKRELEAKTNKYLYESDYYTRVWDDSTIRILMRFQTSRKNHSKSSLRYASEIAKIISGYQGIGKPMKIPMYQESLF